MLTFPPLSSVTPSLTAIGVLQYGAEYSIGGAQSEALVETIDRLQVEGIEVLLVSSPVHAESFGFLASGCDDLALYRDEIEKIVNHTGVRFLNAEGVAPEDTHYFDPVHMTRQGRRVSTVWLANEIASPTAKPPISPLDQQCGRG